MIRWLQFASLVIICAVSTACHTLSHRIVYDPAPAVERLKHGGTVAAEVDALAQPLIASQENVGIVVGVITPDGKSQVFSYGQRAAYDPTPPDAKSPFVIGSLTKMFESATMVRLVEEGAIHYDDTIRSILPPSIPLTKEAGAITLYQLATHTSGLKREPATLISLRHFLRYLFSICQGELRVN